MEEEFVNFNDTFRNYYNYYNINYPYPFDDLIQDNEDRVEERGKVFVSKLLGKELVAITTHTASCSKCAYRSMCTCGSCGSKPSNSNYYKFDHIEKTVWDKTVWDRLIQEETNYCRQGLGIYYTEVRDLYPTKELYDLLYCIYFDKGFTEEEKYNQMKMLIEAEYERYEKEKDSGNQ